MCTEKAGVTVDDDMISDFHRKIGVGVGCNAFVVGIFAVGSRPDPRTHLWLIIHPGAFSPWQTYMFPAFCSPKEDELAPKTGTMV